MVISAPGLHCHPPYASFIQSISHLKVASGNIMITDVYDIFYELNCRQELHLLVRHPCGVTQDDLDLVRFPYGAHSTLPTLGGWRRPGNTVTSALR